MLHDVIVRNIAENIATISSRFNNGPPSRWQLDPPVFDEKPTPSTPPTSSTASSHAPSTSKISGSLSSMAPFISRTPLPQLKQENYPKVRYWYADRYTSRRKNRKDDDDDDDEEEKPKLKGDTSVLSSFMEDENGNPIPNGLRSATRKAAKGFFQLLLEVGRAPSKWGSASIDIVNELIYRLEDGFPFLRLCDGHWKAAQIATNSYSQWYPIAVKNRAATLAKQVTKKPAESQVIDIDADDIDADNIDADNINSNEPQKRPRDEDNETRRPKRPRVEGTEPAPPPACPPIVTTQRQRVRKSFYYD